MSDREDTAYAESKVPAATLTFWALKLIATTADGKNTPFDLPAATAQSARKAGWRRVRE